MKIPWQTERENTCRGMTTYIISYYHIYCHTHMYIYIYICVAAYYVYCNLFWCGMFWLTEATSGKSQTWRLRQGSMAWSWRWPCWSPSPCRKTRNSSEKHRFRLHLGSCLTKESGKTQPFARRFHLAKNLVVFCRINSQQNTAIGWHYDFTSFPFVFFCWTRAKICGTKSPNTNLLLLLQFFLQVFFFLRGHLQHLCLWSTTYTKQNHEPNVSKIVQMCPHASTYCPQSPGPHFLSSVCQSSAWKGARATPRHHQLPSGSHPA